MDGIYPSSPGIIINNKLFKGSYGMAGEYELSPLDKDLTWANLVGYKFFHKRTEEIFGKILLSPVKSK